MGSQIAVIKATLKYTTQEELIRGMAPLISRRGLFIHTRTTRPVGSDVHFEFQLADGSQIYSGDGIVRKEIPFVGGPSSQKSGMLITLKRINRAFKTVVDAILESTGNVPSDIQSSQELPQKQPQKQQMIVEAHTADSEGFDFLDDMGDMDLDEGLNSLFAGIERKTSQNEMVSDLYENPTVVSGLLERPQESDDLQLDYIPESDYDDIEYDSFDENPQAIPHGAERDITPTAGIIPGRYIESDALARAEREEIEQARRELEKNSAGMPDENSILHRTRRSTLAGDPEELLDNSNPESALIHARDRELQAEAAAYAANESPDERYISDVSARELLNAETSSSANMAVHSGFADNAAIANIPISEMPTQELTPSIDDDKDLPVAPIELNLDDESAISFNAPEYAQETASDNIQDDAQVPAMPLDLGLDEEEARAVSSNAPEYAQETASDNIQDDAQVPAMPLDLGLDEEEARAASSNAPEYAQETASDNIQDDAQVPAMPLDLGLDEEEARAVSSNAPEYAQETASDNIQDDAQVPAPMALECAKNSGSASLCNAQAEAAGIGESSDTSGSFSDILDGDSSQIVEQEHPETPTQPEAFMSSPITQMLSMSNRPKPRAASAAEPQTVQKPERRTSSGVTEAQHKLSFEDILKQTEAVPVDIINTNISTSNAVPRHRSRKNETAEPEVPAPKKGFFSSLFGK